ncbi:MAG: DinB family protein [Leptolyngbya sp. PLA3]|nr:MAG: DinB family protein [Cyanobacteria bacterium CYA]MCE7969137.1 DinB family protein [Leptolyngbya sp. PL-A3]
MEPAHLYDYLARARSSLFDRVCPRTPEHYDRKFEIGPGSLARTFTHVLISEWYYVERLMRRDVPPYPQWPIRDEDRPAFAALESAWREQDARTREAIAAMCAPCPRTSSRS